MTALNMGLPRATLTIAGILYSILLTAGPSLDSVIELYSSCASVIHITHREQPYLVNIDGTAAGTAKDCDIVLEAELPYKHIDYQIVTYKNTEPGSTLTLQNKYNGEGDWITADEFSVSSHPKSDVTRTAWKRLRIMMSRPESETDFFIQLQIAVQPLNSEDPVKRRSPRAVRFRSVRSVRSVSYTRYTRYTSYGRSTGTALGIGAIIGIIVGVLGFVGAIVVACFCYRSHQRRQATQTQYATNGCAMSTVTPNTHTGYSHDASKGYPPTNYEQPDPNVNPQFAPAYPPPYGSENAGYPPAPYTQPDGSENAGYPPAPYTQPDGTGYPPYQPDATAYPTSQPYNNVYPQSNFDNQAYPGYDAAPVGLPTVPPPPYGDDTTTPGNQYPSSTV